jgi:hypothetical protein
MFGFANTLTNPRSSAQPLRDSREKGAVDLEDF